MGIETEGFGDLAAQLRELAEKASGPAANKALTAGARPIFEEMSHQATIDPKKRSGNLYESIKVGNVSQTVRKTDYKASKKITIGAHKREMGAYAPHAHLVEYGHGGPAPAPPHPFVRPAFDKKSGEAYAEMKRVLNEELFE